MLLYAYNLTLSWLIHHLQCEIRQTFYQLSYPGSATTHSVRSGKCSTNWAILARPPLTVWDQAGQMLYRLSYPGLSTTHSVRSGRHSTDWAIPAWPPLTVWDQADGLLTELSRLSHHSQCEIRQTLYRLSYPGLATTHSVRSGRCSTDWAIPAQLGIPFTFKLLMIASMASHQVILPVWNPIEISSVECPLILSSVELIPHMDSTELLRPILYPCICMYFLELCNI